MKRKKLARKNTSFAFNSFRDDDKELRIKAEHYEVVTREFFLYNVRAEKLGLSKFDGVIPTLCVPYADSAFKAYCLSALGETAFFHCGDDDRVVWILPHGDSRPSFLIVDKDADIFSVYKLAAVNFDAEEFKAVLNGQGKADTPDDEELFCEYRAGDGKNSKNFKKIFKELGAGIFSCDVDDAGKLEMFVENYGKIYRVKPYGEGYRVFLT